MMTKYLVVIEKGETSFGAYVPDLPGCVAIGESAVEVEGLIREAIEFHVEGLLLDGEEVPASRSEGACAEIDIDVLRKKIRRKKKSSSG